MAINRKKAVQLAIRSMQAEIRQYWAFNANLHDQYGIQDDFAIRASKRKKELEEAIEILAGMVAGPVKQTAADNQLSAAR